MAQIKRRRPISSLAKWLEQSNKLFDRYEAPEADQDILLIREMQLRRSKKRDHKEQEHGEFRIFCRLVSFFCFIFTYYMKAAFSAAKQFIKGKSCFSLYHIKR
jgi:hypothetical protein